ncbi:beta-lactamase domain protein [Coprobacillus sp. CAG:698]|nr:beta-lactamase domain protein [Coprobacillus sp. CAG:698]
MAKKRKKKKNSSWKVIVVIALLVVIIGVGVFLGYPSYKKGKEALQEFNKIEEKFNESIPKETDKDLNYFEMETKYFSLLWQSNNEELLNNSGKCFRPTYKEGNKSVRIVLNCKLKEDLSTIDKFIFNSLNVKEKNIEKDVLVLSMPKTDLDKVEEVLESLLLPEKVLASFELPTEISFYPEMTLKWESSDTSVITETGEKKSLGSVVLKVKATLNSAVLEKEFSMESVDKVTFTEINYDFSDYEDDTYGKTTYDNITFNSSLSENEMVKFKTNENEAYFETNTIIKNMKTIKFAYQFVPNDLALTKNTYVKLYLSTDKINWVEAKQEILIDKEKHEFNYTVDSKDYYVKVEITSEYKNVYVYVDDIVIKRNITKDDIISSIAIPETIKDNVVLPFTSRYGGVVKYISSNENLTSDGKVTRLDSSQIASLTVEVTGFDFEVKFDKDIKISGSKEVTPVEIRFIDVGKYGHNDCGESILIKYNDIEVLIDAGDRYDDTFVAIREVIDSVCQDKVLEYVIATHPDSDHIGSMDDVINTYEVRNIIRFMGDASSEIYKRFDEASKNEVDCNVCMVLDSYNNVGSCKRVITLGEEVYIEIINTQNYEQKENNARSVVCVLNAYGVRTLFTGDADNNSSELEKAYMNVVGDIDILKVVHHGTRNGTTKEFLETVKPEVAIVCNGNYFGNKHGHPTYEALERIYEYNSNTQVYAIVGGDAENCQMTTSGSYKCEPTDYMLDRNGTILLTIDGNGYQLSSEYYGTTIKEVRDTSFWKARSMIK